MLGMHYRGPRFIKLFFLSILLSTHGITFSQSGNGPVYIIEKNGKKGTISSDGKNRIPAIYDAVGWSDGDISFHNGVIGYRKNGIWGLVSEKGQVIISPKYKDLVVAGGEYLFASRVGRYSAKVFYGMLNTKGDLIIPFSYSRLTLHGNVVIAQKLEHNRTLFGLFTKDNVPLLPFSYAQIYPISDKLLGVSRPGSKIKLINEKAIYVLQYPVDSIAPAESGYLLIFDEGKAGLLKPNGDPFISPEFKRIDFGPSHINALHLNEWVFVNSEFQTLGNRRFDDISEVQRNTYIVTINRRKWLSNNESFITSKPYDHISAEGDGFFKVKTNDKSGFMDAHGQEIIPVHFDSIYYERPFLYALKLKGKTPQWSIYDTLGIKKTRHEYQSVKVFSENRFAVKRNQRWGFINRSGDEVIHCVFEDVESFQWRKTKVRFHGATGVLDPYGDWIIYPGFDEITIINDSLYLENKDGQSSLKSFDDKLIYFTDNPTQVRDNYIVETVDSSTQWFVSFHGTFLDRNDLAKQTITESITAPGYFIIEKNGLASMVKGTGEVIIPFEDTQHILNPTEGLIGIKRADHYGFVDFQNRLRIANRYEAIGQFQDGMAAIRIRGGWGFINKHEDIIIQPLYDSVSNFLCGVALIQKDDKWGMINTKGQMVQNLGFDRIIPMKNGLWITLSDHAFGLLSPSGRSILGTKYDSIEPLANGYVILKRKGKYGICDLEGVFKIPLLYDQIKFAKSGNLFLVMNAGNWISYPLEN